MPRDGNGIMELPPLNPVTAGEVILAEWANNTMADVRDALTASIAKDGQTVPTANLPMGGFKHTNCANATARNQYATLANVQEDATRHLGLVTSSNGNDLVGATAPAFSTLVEGQIFTLRKDANPNTGASTLAINGMSSVAILRPDGTALQSGDIPANTFAMVQYTFGVFILLNAPSYPKPTGAGSGLDADMLDGQHGAYYAAAANPSFTGNGGITGNFSVNGVAYANSPAYGDNSTALVNTNHLLTALAVRLGTINGVPVMMHVSSAPAGWTRMTGFNNDRLIRMNNDTAMTSGGATGVSAWAAVHAEGAPHAAGGHSLSVAELAAHTHGGAKVTSTVTVNAGVGATVPSAWNTVTDSAGSGAAHSHSMDLRVAWVDMTLCQKD